MTVALAPVALRACSTVSKIGIPSRSVPPLPGTTPPTIWVPYSLHARVWSWPVAPVIPWVSTRVFLFTRMLIRNLTPNPFPLKEGEQEYWGEWQNLEVRSQFHVCCIH